MNKFLADALQGALSSALLAGDHQAVAEIIDKGADPNQRHTYTPHPLLISMILGSVPMAEALVSRGCRLSESSDSKHPFEFNSREFSEKGITPPVRVERMADPKKSAAFEDQRRRILEVATIVMAAEAEHPKSAAFFKRALGSICTEMYPTSLHMAAIQAMRGHADMNSILLDDDGDPCSPLSLILQRGLDRDESFSVNVARPLAIALLEAGSDPSKNPKGTRITPLRSAIRKSDFELADLLCKAGADPVAEDRDNSLFKTAISSFFLASRSFPLAGKSRPVLDEEAVDRAFGWLISHGCDPNSSGKTGETALHWLGRNLKSGFGFDNSAPSCNDLAFWIGKLANVGADPGIHDKNGHDLLDIAKGNQNLFLDERIIGAIESASLLASSAKSKNHPPGKPPPSV